MEKKKTETVTVRVVLPAEVVEKIDGLAKRRGLGRSTVLRMLILEYLESLHEPESFQPRNGT